MKNDNIVLQSLNANMIKLIQQDDLKSMKFRVTLELQSGQIVSGTYLDYCDDPLNRPDFSKVKFIKYREPYSKGDIIYIPVTQIQRIGWDM